MPCQESAFHNSSIDGAYCIKILSMDNYSHQLKQRFYKRIKKHWKQNNHDLKAISCVYVMLAYNIYEKEVDIVYVGSTTNLNLRYRSHKIPSIIQKSDRMNIMYFLPMDKGFYDYEIKLIKKLKPLYNKQHKN